MDNLIVRINQEPEEIKEMILKFYFDSQYKEVLEKARKKKLHVLAVIPYPTFYHNVLIHKLIFELYDFFVPFEVFETREFKQCLTEYSRKARKELKFELLHKKSLYTFFTEGYRISDEVSKRKTTELREHNKFIYSTRK